MVVSARKNKDPMEVTDKGYQGYFDLSRKQLFELIEKKQEKINKAQEEISDWVGEIDQLNGDIEELLTILREGADGEFVIHDDQNLPCAKKHIQELRIQADMLQKSIKRT